MINQSASRVGTLVFKSGIRNTLYVGTNSNTGETILWQQCGDRRAKRSTGRNIRRVVRELSHVLASGAARWDGEVNGAALAVLQQA